MTAMINGDMCTFVPQNTVFFDLRRRRRRRRGQAKGFARNITLESRKLEKWNQQPQAPVLIVVVVFKSPFHGSFANPFPWLYPGEHLAHRRVFPSSSKSSEYVPEEQTAQPAASKKMHKSKSWKPWNEIDSFVAHFQFWISCWSMLMKFSIWFEFPKLPGLTAFLHKFSISIHQPLTLNAIGSTGNPPIPPVTVVPDPSASGGLHGTLDFDIQQEVHDFIQLQQDLLDQFLWPQKINPTGR